MPEAQAIAQRDEPSKPSSVRPLPALRCMHAAVTSPLSHRGVWGHVTCRLAAQMLLVSNLPETLTEVLPLPARPRAARRPARAAQG